MVKQRINIPKPIREQVLKEYSHHCARCNESNPQLHHIDENPSNNDPYNLIPLCPNCHHNWFHNSVNSVEIGRLQFFRRYKHPFILKPKFQPLFKRLQFLTDIRDNAEVNILRASAAELIRFVKAYEMGEFYSAEIGRLLKYHEFRGAPSYGKDSRPSQWYIDGKNNERPQYLKQLRDSREQLFELVVEMLSYQNWGESPS